MIPRKTLEDASFWDLGVCLDCVAVQGHARFDLDDEAPVCDECGSDAVLAASLILRCADLIEGEG